MKEILCLLMVVFFCSTSFAREMTEDQMIRARMYDRFGTMAGVWWLNQKCEMLSSSDSEKMDKMVAYINITGMQTWGVPAMLKNIIMVSKKVAAETKCDEKARDIITAGFQMTKDVYQFSKTYLDYHKKHNPEIIKKALKVIPEEVDL